MPSAVTSPNLWETVKSDFKGLFPEDVYQLWFEPITCLEAGEDTLVLGVPNDFAAIWINDNYLDLIVQRLRLTSGRLIDVKLKKSGAVTGNPSRTESEVSAPRAKPA
ncbi:DnaA N-terminal domain-containing protein, partial [Rariglobus hedericola]